MRQIPVFNIETFERTFSASDMYANNFARHIISNKKLVHKPHTHDFYLCVLFTAGSGIHEIDFTTYPIQSGSVFFLNPGQTHFWKFDSQPEGYIFFHSLTLFEVAFPGQRLENFPFYYSVNNSPVLNLNSNQTESIKIRFEEIFAEYSSENTYKTEKITSLINLTYIDLSRIYSTGKEKEKSKFSSTYSSTLRAFEKLLEEYFKNEKSASFYAEKLNITTKHLNRILKTILNKTTTDLISERTLLEAKRLIVHTTNSLTDISGILGYADYAYFSRIFKAKTHQTPLSFKNNYSH